MVQTGLLTGGGARAAAAGGRADRDRQQFAGGRSGRREGEVRRVLAAGRGRDGG